MKLSRITITLLLVLVNLGFAGCSKIIIRNDSEGPITVNVLSLKIPEDATLKPNSYTPKDVTTWFENQTDVETHKKLTHLKKNHRYAGIELEKGQEKKWTPNSEDTQFKHSKDRTLLVLVYPPKGCKTTVGFALEDLESAVLSFDSTHGLIVKSDGNGSQKALSVIKGWFD